IAIIVHVNSLIPSRLSILQFEKTVNIFTIEAIATHPKYMENGSRSYQRYGSAEMMVCILINVNKSNSMTIVEMIIHCWVNTTIHIPFRRKFIIGQYFSLSVRRD